MSLFDHDGNFGHVLGRTSRALLNMLQKKFKAAGFDITVEQWTLLINIRNADGQAQQHVADRVYRDKTTVTRVAEGLEKKGLIRRVPDDTDRRQKRVHITPAGIDLLEAVKPVALAAQQQVLHGIERQKIHACRDVLMQLYHNILNE